MGKRKRDVARAAVLAELRRIGKVIRGDPDAYEDLIVQLESAWEELDQHEDDPGRPLSEENDDA